MRVAQAVCVLPNLWPKYTQSRQSNGDLYHRKHFYFLIVGDLVWPILSKVARLFPYSRIRRNHHIIIHNRGNSAICTVPKIVQPRIAIGRRGVKMDRRSYRGGEPGAAGGGVGNRWWFLTYSNKAAGFICSMLRSAIL